MSLKSLSLCVLSIFVIFFGLETPALAIDPSSISVDVAPSNPAPFENTTITLSSFSANLDSVLITWFMDGKNSLSGIGRKSFSLTAKAANSETKILVKIFLPDGEIDKNITIRPSSLVLLWQADDSYVPPFYKGKALPSASSEIKVVAIPEIKVGGVMVDSKNMTYAWKKNYNNSPDDSGYGKNFLIYTNDYLEDSTTVGVVASTVDQNYSSESSIAIGTFSPEISFYKQDSILGTMWENALSNGHKINGDEIIVATPYFISPKDWRRPELVFNWSIDDRTITVPSFTKNLMPLRVQTGTSGTSKLKLDIENTEKIFQTSTKEITIIF